MLLFPLQMRPPVVVETSCGCCVVASSSQLSSTLSSSSSSSSSSCCSSVLLDNVLVKYGLEPFQRAMSFQRAAWTGVRNFVDADHKVINQSIVVSSEQMGLPGTVERLLHSPIPFLSPLVNRADCRRRAGSSPVGGMLCPDAGLLV